MVLTKKQQEILVGLMLGDGHLEFNGYRGTRLQVKQMETKKEYVDWLFNEFANIVRTPPQQRPDTRQWYFGTRYFVELEQFRKLFYEDRKKIIPKNIAELITTPLTLAIWFMDDGTLDYRAKSHYAFSLSTDSFTFEDVELLQNVLESRFGIRSSIQTPSSRGTRYVKLYIGKDGRDEFLRIVRPHILSCFSYKLPPQLDPSETLLARAG